MGTDSFARLVFNKVYKTDIERLRSTEELWKYRRRPDPLDFETVNTSTPQDRETRDATLLDDQKVWSLEQNLIVFKDRSVATFFVDHCKLTRAYSLDRLSKRFAELKTTSDAGASAAEPSITFDKDDVDSLDFVTASANLRSIIFGIAPASRFDVKQIAGNIIPAIATTNAIVAGLCVLESYKLLRGDYDAARELYLTPFIPERLLGPDRLRAPNPDCPICSVAQSRLLVDFERATLGNLVESILKLELGYSEEIAVAEGENHLYDIEETHNLDKKLSELGMFRLAMVLCLNTNVYKASRMALFSAFVTRMMHTPMGPESISY